ncbi:MAG: terminase [Gammaproteobacteria bacterium]
MYIDQAIRRRLELIELIENGAPLWLPDPDNAPQMAAYLSPAKVIGFGGAAGGGKSDLGIGKALNQHFDSFIARRVGTELTPIIERVLALRGTRDGYASAPEKILRMPERNQVITFGAMPNLGDETKYQGHPHDFKCFDEATNFLEYQVRFLSTWLRNTRIKPEPFCQMLLTFNPPQTSEGRWVLSYFAPWLDKQYKNPAAHGELRYFITVGQGQRQVDIEVPNVPHVIVNNEPVRDFDPREFKPTEIITPQSRTFIGSRVTDNKYQGAQYMAQLQSLPEPLRSQMLNGDFYAGINDSEWQVIPTEWVKAAMDRWQPRDRKPRMDSIGVDVARGGQDNSILIRRHDNWYDEVIVYPGTQTPNGPMLAGLIASHLRDDATIYIDVVGVGGSPYDFLREQRYHVIGINGGSTEGLDAFRSQGGMGFANWKSYLWWAMREDLDPANNRGVALPPDPALLRDLTAPLWRPRGGKILVESREEIIKRIGRSPDWGSACVLARLSTPRIERLRTSPNPLGHDPLAITPFIGGGGHTPF